MTPRGRRRAVPPPGWQIRLFRYARTCPGSVALAVVGAVVGGGVAAGTPLLERQILDASVLHHTRSVAPWLWLLAGAAAVTFLTSHLRRLYATKVVLHIQSCLRNDIHRRLQVLGAGGATMPVGQLISRANSDINVISRYLSMFPLLSGIVFMTVCALAVMLNLSVMLTLASLTVVPAVVLTTSRLKRLSRVLVREVQQRAGEVAEVMDQAISAVTVVKVFGQERREIERVRTAARVLFRIRMAGTYLFARYQPILEALPMLGQVLILALGGWLAVRHSITVGTFLAFSMYLAHLANSASVVGRAIPAAQQSRAAAERIFELLDTVPEVRDRYQARALDQVRGQIDFTGVGFSYTRSQPVLKNLNLRIEAGQTVALVGGSGSGKTTAALLVARFFDVQEGSVALDGHDVRDITLGSLRRQIGFVFEDTFLFAQSLRDNIAYGHPDASDAEIEAVARAADVHGFASRLPEGYDTVLGERGMSLSGGQRQRVALARALLKNPRVLVLDDATSAVDAAVEQEIVATLGRVSAGRTTILITHRRAMLELADRIIVLDGGELVDQGGYAELWARSQVFRNLLEPDAEQDRAPAAARLPAAGAAPMSAAVPAAPSAAVDLDPDADRAWTVEDEAGSHASGFSFWDSLREFRPLMALGFLLVLLDTVGSLVGPLFSREGIDRGVLSGSAHVLFAAAAAFTGIALARLLVGIFAARVTGRAGELMLYRLRVRVWARIQRLGVDFYEREAAGRILTRATVDVDSMYQLFNSVVIRTVTNCLTLLGAVVFMTVTNPELALITCTALIPMGVATVLYRRASKGSYTRGRESLSRVNAGLRESIAGIRESQAFGREASRQAEFEQLTAHYVAVRMRAARALALYFPFVEFLTVISSVPLLWLGAQLITEHRLSVGALVAFLLYLDVFFVPLVDLSDLVDSWQQSLVSVARIKELMELPILPPLAERPLPVPPRLGREIVLDRVGFSYPKADAPAVSGVSLRVPAGSTVAFVGRTGSGKSTLIRIAARLYDPTEGRVLVDGTDLRDLDLAGYRARIGYVPQEPVLFAGTVRENIAYGRPEASQAEIHAAAAAVGVHGVVAGLPGGYDHPVGDRGQGLSAGERQLICLARAELADPDLLLLDEATSSLDPVTEAQVGSALERLRSRRTTFLVAHRLSSARGADLIVVLDAGRIAESGTHDRLLAAGGRYSELWAAWLGGTPGGPAQEFPEVAPGGYPATGHPGASVSA